MRFLRQRCGKKSRSESQLVLERTTGKVALQAHEISGFEPGTGTPWPFSCNVAVNPHFQFMDFTLQSSRAKEMHSTVPASGEKTSIDCHEGIAHRLPDMSGVSVGADHY